MEKVREVVSGTLSMRKTKQIRVRQPPHKLTVVVENTDAVAAYDEILKSELNVKNVELCTLEDAEAQGLKIINELRVNARVAGKRLRKDVPVRYRLQVRRMACECRRRSGMRDAERRDRA